jgi:hypothetical protein
MNMIMKLPPQIQSIGVPSDQHAERIMAEMAKYLALEGEKLTDFASLSKAFKANDAKPEGQIKIAHMVADAIGPLCIDIPFIETGARGKYKFALLCLSVKGPYTAKPIVSLYLNCFRSFGNGHQVRDSFLEPCFDISNHALSRLAQRVGVRTLDDLLSVLREMAKNVVETLLEKEDTQEWRVELDDGFSAILKRDPNNNTPTVITVLDKEMI